MAIGVDTSTWKPRQVKGTPAARSRNVVAALVLGVGILAGAFYQFSGVTAKYRKALNVLYEDPEEEVERRALIAGGIVPKTGDQIRQIQEDFGRPDRPDK